MKKIIITLTLLFPIMLFASFSGTIVDKTTFEPLTNVTLSDSRNSVQSDKNGHFILDSNESCILSA